MRVRLQGAVVLDGSTAQAETAITNSLTLVTEDADLLKIVTDLAGHAVRITDMNPSAWKP